MEEALAAGLRTPEQFYDFMLGRMLQRYAADSTILQRLTVTQAVRLLRNDCWVVGAITLNADLTLEDFGDAPLPREVRALLSRIGAGPGIKLTEAGRFNGAFAEEMLDSMIWPDLGAEGIRAVCKVINETDVPPLHQLRVLIEFAGLTRKHKGHLRLARGARQLLEPEATGKLSALLFRTLFTRFNLAYLDRSVMGIHLQRHAPLTLYMISREAEAWIAPAELQQRVVAPDDEMLHASQSLRVLVFESRILDPLTWLGLLERREQPGRAEGRRDSAVRKTALFDRFLSFHLPAAHGET